MRRIGSTSRSQEAMRQSPRGPRRNDLQITRPSNKVFSALFVLSALTRFAQPGRKPCLDTKQKRADWFWVLSARRAQPGRHKKEWRRSDRGGGPHLAVALESPRVEREGKGVRQAASAPIPRKVYGEMSFSCIVTSP